MGEFLKTPAVAAAIISSSIMAFGIVIQWLIAFTKNNFNAKTNFENSLKEKLENIYSPLIMLISKSNLENKFITDEVLVLLNKYGYLLSKELLSDLKELYKVESEKPKDIDIDTYIIEYKNLREKVNKQANKEFNELQNLYNGAFNSYKNNLLKPWYRRVISFIKNGCLLITSVFWVILIVSFLIDILISKAGIIDESMNDFIALILAMIITITSLFGIVALIFRGLDRLEARAKAKKNFYSPQEYVPISKLYRCRVCGETKKFYKYDQFTLCKNNKLFYEIGHIMYDSIWVLQEKQIDTRLETK